MGCDIHAFIEKKTPQGWRFAGTYENGYDDFEGKQVPADSYNDRNYEVFNILAGVRGDLYPPISAPRGLPPEQSPELVSGLAQAPDSYGPGNWLGDHSYSWLTLRELLDYDWAQSGEDVVGWVDALTFEKWNRYTRAFTKDSPDNWCAAVGGGGVKHITEAEMRQKIKDIEDGVGSKYGTNWATFRERVAKELNHYYCEIRWQRQASKAAGDFYNYYMPLWKRLDPNPDNVRLVFGFDN